MSISQAVYEAQIQRIADLQARLADYELLKRAVNETGDCLPDCDSYAHNEQCPNVNNHVVLQDKQREIESLRSRLAEARADMTRLLRDGIVNAPCPTPAQWRQLQDFAKGYLAGADSATVEGEKC